MKGEALAAAIICAVYGVYRIINSIDNRSDSDYECTECGAGVFNRDIVCPECGEELTGNEDTVLGVCPLCGTKGRGLAEKLFRERICPMCKEKVTFERVDEE